MALPAYIYSGQCQMRMRLKLYWRQAKELIVFIAISYSAFWRTAERDQANDCFFDVSLRRRVSSCGVYRGTRRWSLMWSLDVSCGVWLRCCNWTRGGGFSSLIDRRGDAKINTGRMENNNNKMTALGDDWSARLRGRKDGKYSVHSALMFCT